MSARSKRVAFVILLFIGLLLLPGYAKRGKKHPDDSTVYDVRNYGVAADGVEATGCDAAEDTPMDCDTPGTGTDDGPVITAAIAAAGAAGGGEVFIPCGLYSIATAIKVDVSNVTIQGEGACTVLLARIATNPHYVFDVCDEYADVCAIQITNIHIKDLVIRDDDPFSHGLGSTERAIVVVDTVSAAFDYGETVTFTGSGVTGRFYWQDVTGGAAGNDKTMIFTSMSGSIEVADALAGDESLETGTVDTLTQVGATTEESHGIRFGNCVNCSVTDTRISFVGDEPIDITHSSEDILISRNFFDNNPGTPSSGSGVTAQASVRVTISHNFFEGGLASGPGGGSIMAAAIGHADGITDRITFSDNHFNETYDDQGDHRTVQIGVRAASSAGDVDHIVIDSNTFNLDPDLNGTCDTDGSLCREDGDCVGGEGTYCENHDRNCAGTFSCGAITASDTGPDNVINVGVNNNHITGYLALKTDITVGSTNVTNNPTITGDNDIAIRLQGATVNVVGNNTSGHGWGGINVQASGEVNVLSNVFKDQGDLNTAGDAIIMMTDDSAADTLNVGGNTVIGKNAGGSNVALVNCKDIAGANVFGNYLVDADHTAVSNCNNISGNVILAATNVGIGSSPANSKIVNNHIDLISTDGDCIDVDGGDANGGNGIVITGNVLISGPGNDKGIDLDQVDDCVITGNLITGSLDAIELSASNDCVIAVNSLTSTINGSGLDITTSDRVVVADNVVNILSNTAPAINIDGMDHGTITGNVITVDNAGADPIETTNDTYLNVKNNVSTFTGATFDLGGGAGSTNVNNLEMP